MKNFSRILMACLLAFFMLNLTAGCSEKAERVAAAETADQMEAERRGREAAKKIVSKEWPDTMQLQMAVLDARAEASRYEIAGDEKSKARFDTAFAKTIRTVRPELAAKLGL